MLSPVAASRGAAPPLSPWTGRSPSSVTPDGAPPCHPGRSEAEIRGPGGRRPCQVAPTFLGPGSSPGRQIGGPGTTVWGSRGGPSPVAADGAQPLFRHPARRTPPCHPGRSEAEIRGPDGHGPCRGVPAFLGPGSSPGRQLGGRDDRWGSRGGPSPCHHGRGASSLHPERHSPSCRSRTPPCHPGRHPPLVTPDGASTPIRGSREAFTTLPGIFSH